MGTERPAISTSASCRLVASAWARAVSTAPGLGGHLGRFPLRDRVRHDPAPACTYAVPSRSTTLRMVMAASDVLRREVADGAAVRPTSRSFDLRDGLHRAHLLGAGQRARREGRADRVERVQVRRAAGRAPPRRGASRGSSAPRRTAPAIRRCRPPRCARRRCVPGRRASRAPASSFSSARRSASSSASRTGSSERGRVPAMGRVTTSPSRTRTSSSGEAPRMERPGPRSIANRCGDGLMRRSAR